MSNFKSQATHVAKTENAEIVVIAVSKHLGPHSFQVVRGTPGASPFLNFARDLNQDQHHVARLQSHITGYSSKRLAKMIECKKPACKFLLITLDLFIC